MYAMSQRYPVLDHIHGKWLVILNELTVNLRKNIYDHSAVGYASHAHGIVLFYSVVNKTISTTTNTTTTTNYYYLLLLTTINYYFYYYLLLPNTTKTTYYYPLLLLGYIISVTIVFSNSSACISRKLFAVHQCNIRHDTLPVSDDKDHVTSI